MSTAALDHLRRTAAQRKLAIVALAALPLVVAAAVLAARIGGSIAAFVVVVLALAATAAIAWRAWCSVDEGWLARRLDASAVQMDDSAALLFHDGAALSELQRLQQMRVHACLAEINLDLRPAWPWPRLFVACGVALVLLIAAATWQPSARSDTEQRSATAHNAAAATALVRTRIAVEPPAYTHVTPSDETSLDVKAPEGSRLRWSLRFDPEPQAAALVFHDGSRMALTRDGADWHGERALNASVLYRIALDGVPPPADDRLHRLDAIADRAPEIRVLEPEKTLTVLDTQQKNWYLAFEADDDYGIAAAELQITLAQGSGENVKFKEQTVALEGEPVGADGGVKHQRYRHRLDLAALGVAQGDDVVVRLAVSDNREPKPNITRSASFILRWPAQASQESAGLEGVVQKTMPAYFRSQRQIIIDSEALQSEKPKLDDKAFLARSDAIGVDQKILRLRYGQFLGEESETHAQHAEAAEQAADSAHEHGGEHDDHDEHAHAPRAGQEAATFGKEGDIVAEFGHVHDIAEAATLLDAETKATLKSALAEMWQAELHLRQGRPDEALPYEYRALDFIKRVQQSTRIYLERVGLELPAPDEARRLSGERKGVEDRSGSLAAATIDDAPLARLWSGLQRGDAADANAIDWSGAEEWLRAREASLPDALAVLAAIDRTRRDPACAECRDSLRALLWPLLPAPAATGAARATPDAAGRAYLDALQSDAGGAR
ncbi:MAG: DUF4175 family protein [Rudaea sp.]|uniref:DUF4175 family protein n=1 Tax=unclassified Rudaea TaxID=2627037 RepID=UPI001484CA02|nr:MULTISPECIES: DUF4175 family protein [unclassified Rudaea]MBN8887904.1 DUF4175 family protein [Rudaea sp.]